MDRQQSGNALIYVLIGVSLFAALGYALSKSNRGSTAALSAERANLAASEIIGFANTVQSATGQIRLRGYGEDAVSFENDFVAGYANGNCPDEICRIFHIDGGAVVYKEPPSEWLDSGQSAEPGYGEWVVTGNNAVEQVGDGAESDLVLFLPYIKRDICLAINDRLDVENPFAEPPEEADTINDFSDYFTGAYGNPGPVEILTLPASSRGAQAACFEGASTPPAGTYHYFHVLLAR